MHSGTDFAAKAGTRISAPAEGKVIGVGFNNVAGHWVRLQHANGRQTRYLHMSAVSVKEGDIIGAGMEVGKVGSTGRSTGPHLHLELKDSLGNLVDPLKYWNKPTAAEIKAKLRKRK